MKNTIRKAAVAGAVVLPMSVLGVAGTASASTATPPPSSGTVSMHIIRGSSQHPNIAYLTGTYKCYGGKQGVIWASVKQGGPDPTAGGSSATVKSWYDAHVLLNCNGVSHKLVVEVHKETPPPGAAAGKSYQNLQWGKAWIQWCITPTLDGDGSTTVSVTKWGYVTVSQPPATG